MTDLCEFTPFPEFPIELRLKVWHHVLPGPRRINCQEPQTTPGALQSCLSVCHESREVALKHYQRTKNNLYPAWIDFNVDAVWSETVLSHINPNPTSDEEWIPAKTPREDIEKIKKVVIDYPGTLTDFTARMCGVLQHRMGYFPKLEEITLVLCQLHDNMVIPKFKRDSKVVPVLLARSALNFWQSEELEQLKDWWLSFGMPAEWPKIPFDAEALFEKEAVDEND